MDLNDLKDKQQKKALNHWAMNSFHGSIIAGTGFGKSRCGVIAVGYNRTCTCSYYSA